MNWKPLTWNTLSGAEKLAIHSLWRRGDVTPMLHPKQIEIRDRWWNQKPLTLTCVLPRQMGKTDCAMGISLEQCIRQPHSNVRYGFPFAKQAREALDPIFFRYMETMPPELRPKRCDIGWRFPNGSTFSMVGVDIDNGNRMRGPKADMITLDECRDMPHLSYLIQSICRPQFNTTNGRLLLVSTPPDVPGHPFTSHYIAKAELNGTLMHYTWRDSPFLTEDRIKEIASDYPMGMNDPGFLLEYEADYSKSNESLRILPGFNPAPSEEFFKNWSLPYAFQKWTFLDSGWNDFTAIIVGLIDPRHGKLVILGEHHGPHMLNEVIAKKITEMENEYFPRHPQAMRMPETERRSDIDPRLLAELSSTHGIPVDRTVKLKSNTTMWAKLRDALHQEKIVIHPRCRNLLWQCKNGMWNKNRTDYECPHEQGHLDLLNALKYANLNVDYAWSMPAYGSYKSTKNTLGG